MRNPETGAGRPVGVAGDARYGPATITPHMLRFVCLVATERGHCLEPALRRAGIGEDTLSTVGTRVSYRQVAQVVREAMDTLDDPALGLAVGRRQQVTAWGLIGFGLLSSPTVRDSLALGMHYQSLAGSALDFRLERTRATAELVASPRYTDPGLQAFLIEESFASLVSVIRSVFGESFTPRAVTVRHPRPAHSVRYLRFFRCPVRFGAPEDRLVLDADWLGRPMPGADAYALSQVVGLLDKAYTRGPERLDLVESVEISLARALPHIPPLAEEARRRAMSERTLRRRLAACGTSYEALADSARRTRAEALLTAGDLPIHKIAAELGFSDSRTLRRAVARWYGRSPSAVRNHSRR